MSFLLKLDNTCKVCHYCQKKKQVVKVIWQKATSLLHTDGSLYTLKWATPCPPPKKIASSHWDLDPHPTHGSLGPPESTTQMASGLVQPLLQGSRLCSQTDRPTIGHMRSTVMQPKKYICQKWLKLTYFGYSVKSLIFKSNDWCSQVLKHLLSRMCLDEYSGTKILMT